MKFTELTLNSDLLSGTKDAGFSDCTPVQERTFTETFSKNDVYVQSQTGSGKTAAFLITIFEHFCRGTFEQNRAIIIVPTRELAVQIENEAKTLGRHLPYRTGSFYGGVGYDKQLKMLEEGYEIIIGTPGRLIDLDQKRKLNFKDSSIVVIDEADRLFDMGFLPDLRKMLRRMPQADNRLTMLFSATMNSRVWHLAWEYMHEPVQVVMNPENLTVSEVHQELYHVAHSDKFKLLLGILDREKAPNILIFTNTKNTAVEVSRRLEYNGYQSQFIIGDLQQRKRLQLIDQMKAGKLQVLVATDVAARGLHIDDLPLVVNYDLPEDPEGYVHRIGRTARAGNTGKAVTLACERYVYSLEAIEELIDTKIPTERHDDSMLLEDKSEGQRIEPHRSETSGRRRDSGRGGSYGARSRQSTGGQSQSSNRRSPRPSTVKDTRSPVPATGAKSPVKATPAASGKPARGGAPTNRPPRKSRPTMSGAQPSQGSRQAPPSADAPMEERLAYYRRKYGEDFKFADQPASKDLPAKGKKPKPAPAPAPKNETNEEKPGKSLLSRIFGRKGRKRS